MARKATKKDLEAKRGFIDAYFDDLRGRIDFLLELRASDHEQEAMLLCCCYIDGLATHLYWPDAASHRNFVRAIRDFSPHEFLARIHPKQLHDAIAGLKGKRAQEAIPFVEALMAESEDALLSAEDVEAFVESVASTQLKAWLGNHLWRGTLASIAYQLLRVPLVHGLGSAGGISFSSATLDGDPVPTISFDILWDTLQPLYDEARERSVTTNQWYGHDFKDGGGA